MLFLIGLSVVMCPGYKISYLTLMHSTPLVNLKHLKENSRKYDVIIYFMLSSKRK